MRFFARWIEDWLGLALALVVAVLAMQAPALTHEYAVALLQVARDARHDIDQRIDSARQFYAITATEDDGVAAALRGVEPSNAETLAAALDRNRRLQASYDRIAAARPLLQPIIAVWEAARDDSGERAIIRRTLLETYVPSIGLNIAAAAYGLAGLLLGTLVSRALLSAGGGLARRFGRGDAPAWRSRGH